MIRHRLTGLVLAVALAASSGTAVSADKKPAFDLRSPAFKEFSSLTKKYTGKNPQFPGCDGGDISPPLVWSGAPAATKSYAIELIDLAGNPPLGNVHWVAYGIPASKTSLKEGEGSAPSASIVSGKNMIGRDAYFGPCPRAGDKPHPFTFLLMATDLAPDALKPGLTRDELAAEIKSHILDKTTLVLRYGH